MLVLALGALTALGASPAQADSMSCGVNLVVVGDYKLEVEDACGKPDSRESHFIDGAYQVRDRFGRRYLVDGIRVETWTYRLGPQRFSRILRFENDRLVRIDKARRRL
ncbi:MAG: DUF2845 domain-containing protein [Pseudomonadota bacterium]